MTTKFWDWMSRRYDDDIKKHDAEYEDTVRAAMDQVSDSDVVLDFACASGELTLAMAARVKRVQGIDASARMIELAQAKAKARAKESPVAPTPSKAQRRRLRAAEAKEANELAASVVEEDLTLDSDEEGEAPAVKLVLPAD